MRRVYDEPATVETVPDERWGERPELVTAWGRTYKVRQVEDQWETMRPWWVPSEQLPDPMSYAVSHWLVAAVSERGSGVLELEARHEGWRVVAVLD